MLLAREAEDPLVRKAGRGIVRRTLQRTLHPESNFEGEKGILNLVAASSTLPGVLQGIITTTTIINPLCDALL